MGDDRWRFGVTNFFPGISSESGIHVNKWTPRLEFSGPLAKGARGSQRVRRLLQRGHHKRAASGQNRTNGLTASDLSRFQVNLTHANTLTGSFLFNLSDATHFGLGILNPLETTTNHRQTLS